MSWEWTTTLLPKPFLARRLKALAEARKIDSTAKTQGNDTCFYPFTPSLTRFWRNESSLLPRVLLPFQRNLFSSTFTLVLIIQHLVIIFESVGEILWCYHSNETSSAVLSHGTNYSVRSCNFWVCGWNPMVLAFKWNLFGWAFAWCNSFLKVLQVMIV